MSVPRCPRFVKLAAALLLAVLPLSACAPERRAENILLITVDTLRADHVGLYGYSRNTTPNIDRFFADAAIFERAYSTTSYTTASVVSLLSGLSPREHGVRLFYQLVDEETRLVCHLLPERFQSAAFVSNAVLSAEALGIDTCFDTYDDEVEEQASAGLIYERSAERTTEAALRWLREERDPDRSVFLWVHYYDPHTPYLPPKDAGLPRFQHVGTLPVDLSRIREQARLAGVDDALEYIDRYDEEIAYVDAQIGSLLEGWKQISSIERDLVIFSADHGENMVEGERWFMHSYHVSEPMIRVALMIRGPGVESRRTRSPVSGIDVLPTILASVGVRHELPGIDLVADTVEGERTVFAEAITEPNGQWRAAIQGDRKWMAQLYQGQIRGKRFHDFNARVGEQHSSGWPRDAQPPGEFVERLQRDAESAGHPLSRQGDANRSHLKVAPRAGTRALEMLRALGYVE